ncbi:MAG: T9SS type A sorting domain-containing protein [Bacteroidota bacterium]
MKKIFFIAIVFVLSSTMYSQEIVNSTKLWSIMTEHCQPWGSNYSTEFFRFDVDTVVNDVVYKKVWISEDENHEEWNFYGAFIREEAGLVYFKEMFEEEGLIYNFNLEIGDSVVINNPRAAGALTLLLVEIDSIELEDGYRERWKLSNSGYPDFEYWIRGIGSETGVINSSTGVYGGLCGLFTLLCEKENDNLIYQNSEIGSCYLYITDIVDKVEITDIEFVLNYNNKTRSLKIRFDESKVRTVFISSITGAEIVKKQISSNYFMHNFTDSKSGLYIVTVIEDGKVVSKKIIIN